MTFAAQEVEGVKEPKHAPAAHLIGRERVLIYLVDSAAV